MFGGLAFLIGGNMAVAASGQGGLMVRVDPEATDTLVAKPHTRPFEMRGRAGRLAPGRRGCDHAQLGRGSSAAWPTRVAAAEAVIEHGAGNA